MPKTIDPSTASPPQSAETISIHSAPGRLRRLINGNFGTHRGLVRLLAGETEYLTGRLDGFLQPDLATTQRLVFVCLGNINRSPFGEYVARSLGLQATSIGLSTSTGAPAFGKASSTALSFGIDLSPHQATDFVDYAPAPGDLLLAMEIRHVHRLIGLGVPRQSIALLGHWAAPQRIHIHDPHTLSDAYYRTCFNVIHSAVHKLAQDCRHLNSPCATP